ncbi:MAG: F0F1 ATP synthase subunit gamma [Desulfovibrio sp.]|jgi:F-type H+-transporting ATPase subunit gamma|nr:F0F1 ATP synthase subunit gamma [Desulfovibrio sp.]
MASLKDVRLKITGVTKTRQITKAMYMVASAKLRGAQQRIERFRPYADKFYDMLRNLGGKAEEAAHPLLEARQGTGGAGIVLCTSDRGLCGGFNANITAAALKFATEKSAAGKRISFYCLGRKGRDAVRSLGHETPLALIGRMNSISYELASETGARVIDDFMSGALDEVHLFYGEFINLARQKPAAIRLLPIAADDTPGPEEKAVADYVYEPTVAELLNELLPRYIKVQIYRALLDTSAGENAARMQAMDNATRNCDEMIRGLTLLMNKTRQAAITNELIDIVGGVEALKG